MSEAVTEHEEMGVTMRIKRLVDSRFVDLILQHRDLDDKLDELVRRLEEPPSSTLPASKIR
jgi:hypothetical protein